MFFFIVCLQYKIAINKCNLSGRPARIIPPNFKKYYEMWKNEEITGVEFAKLLEVSSPTLYRYIREFEEG